MSLTAFGILPQRAVNATWAALGLLALGLSARGFGLPAALAILIPATSGGWIYASLVGNTFGLAGLLLAVSTWFAVRSGDSDRSLHLAIAFAVAAAGARLSMAPFCLVLWLVLAGGSRSLGRAARTAATGVLTAALVFGPFVLLAGSSFWFWTVRYHAQTSFNRRGAMSILEAAGAFPAIVALLAMTAIALPFTWRRLRGVPAGVVAVLAAAGVTVVANLSVKAPYGTYITPLIGPLAAALLATLARLLPPKVLGGAAIVAILPALTTAMIPVDSTLPEDLATAKEVLVKATPPESWVVAGRGDIPMAAGRRVWPGLEMGMFSVTEELPPDEARRLNLVTADGLAEVLEQGCVGAVVLSVIPEWNFSRSVPSLRPISLPVRLRMNAAVGKGFQLAYESPNYRIFVPTRARRLAPCRLPS